MSDGKENLGIQDEQPEPTADEKVAAARLHFMVDSTMSHKAGRDFVWELLARYGVYQDSFDENPIIMARKVGLAGAGLILLDLILSACPEKHDMMNAEHRLMGENQDD